MPSELRHNLFRIATNYVRLFLVVALGLIFLRVLVRDGGKDLAALVLFLGASTGIASTFLEIVRACMTRELGERWHSHDRSSQATTRFSQAYASAIALCGVLGIGALLVSLAIAAAVPQLKIPAEMHTAGRVYVIAKGLELLISVLCTPTINMLRVCERFALFNAVELMQRASQLAAAIIAFVLIASPDESARLVHYSILVASITSLGHVVIVLAAAIVEPALRPKLSHASRATAADIVRESSWNAASITASNLVVPMLHFIMNRAFGLTGNLAMGLAIQFASYIRRFTLGSSDGLDAVAVRLALADTSGQRARTLLHHATRLQTLTALAGGAFIVACAGPFMRLLLGADHPNASIIPLAIPLTIAITPALVVRSISDAWMLILYGSGHVRAYTGLIIAASISAVVLALALLPVLPSTPQIAPGFEHGPDFLAPSLAYSLALAVFQLGVLPPIIGRCLAVPTRAVLAPMLMPAVCVLVSVPTLLLVPRMWPASSIIALGLACAAFAALLVLSTFFLALSGGERAAIFRKASAILRPA